MFSLNRAQIIGNATRDPELRYTPNGQAVCNFSVATNRRYKMPTGEFQEDTQFHDIVAWGKSGELITQMVKKGNKIYIEGRLQTRQWDAPDGSKRSRTEIVMEQFVLLTPKSAQDYSAPSPIGESVQNAPTDDIDQSSAKTSPDSTNKSKKTDEKTDYSPPAQESPTPVDGDDINLDDIPF